MASGLGRGPGIPASGLSGSLTEMAPHHLGDVLCSTVWKSQIHPHALRPERGQFLNSAFIRKYSCRSFKMCLWCFLKSFCQATNFALLTLSGPSISWKASPISGSLA